jgi:hypothetical protein
MTTRRADIQPSPVRSKAAAKDASGNAIADHTLKPVPGEAQSDPSPFTRQKPAEASESRHQRIERIAYRLAQSRGFAPGHELEDWLAAEREIDRVSPEA